MRRQRTPITYPAVARHAGVSRTVLYQNSGARDLMTAAITATGDGRRRARADQDEKAKAAWRPEARPCRDQHPAPAHRAAHRPDQEPASRIRRRHRSAGQRVSAENTTLKQRVRQLADDNRTLTDKLQAARSNNRFLDKRIADLEAQILGTTGGQRLQANAPLPSVLSR